MTTDPKPDTALIEEAVRHHADVRERLAAARINAEKAAAEHAEARAALAAVVAKAAAGEAVDPTPAQTREAEMARATTFAERIVSHLLDEEEKALLGRSAATARAYEPVLKGAKELRIDAAKRLDMARKVEMDARADLERSVNMIGTCRANGCRPDIETSILIRDPMEHQEAAFWREMRV